MAPGDRDELAIAAPVASEGRRGPQTRRRVLKAARAAFATDGFAGATLAQIANASGLRKPSLFAYFATKEALYAAVLDECMVDLVSMLDTAAREATLERAMTAMELHLAADPSVAAALFRELLDQRAPLLKISEKFDILLRGICERWPQVDHQLLMSVLGLHALWWTRRDGDRCAPTRHRARLLQGGAERDAIADATKGHSPVLRGIP